MLPVGLFRSALTSAAAQLGVPVDETQLDLLESHYAAMAAANESMNLTRIIDPVEAAIKHYADSMAILVWARGAAVDQATLLDIGTGAGFPAVPIAVMRPQWQVVAIDGTQKKADFLRRFTKEAGLQNLRVEHGHSDHWDSGQKFDLAVTRAVASLSRCMRTARRFLGPGGRLIAFKTPRMPEEEWEEAKAACRQLRMRLEPAFEYKLEYEGEKLARSLIPVRFAQRK